jgi:methyl-accepting chemotaxis protein
MQWTVRRKLMALAGFWGIMLLVVSSMGIIAVNQGRASADRLIESQVTTLHALGDVRWYVALVRTSAILSATGSGPMVQDQLALGEQRKAQLLEAMTRLKSVPRAAETDALIGRLDSTLQAYLTVRDQVSAHARAGETAAANRMMRTEATQTFQAVVSVADTLGAEALHEAADARSAMATAAQRLQISLAILIALVLVLTGWITWRLTAGINRQVQSLREAMQRVATGDLCTSVPVSSQDDLGTLAENFNWLIGELRGTLETVSGSADRLNDTARHLSQAANDAAMASREVASTVEQLARGSGTQAEAVQQGADEAHRMSDAAGEATHSIVQVDHAASGAASAASQGLENLQVAVRKVADLHASVQGSAEAVGRLNDLSQQIGTIIAMIRGIATQTNLLALNAAIEAARAGEHGRGFAVVAEEVRKLAADSAGNAEQITRMITATQAESQRAMALIDHGMQEADMAVSLIDEANRSFGEIQHAVSDTHHGVHAISTSVQQLSASLQTVSSSMESVAAVAEENAAASEEVSAAVQQQSALVQQVSATSDSLADLSDDMQRLATRFRLSPDREQVGGAKLPALAIGRA